MEQGPCRRRNPHGQRHNRTRHRESHSRPRRRDHFVLRRRVSFRAGCGRASKNGLYKTSLDGRRVEALGRVAIPDRGGLTSLNRLVIRTLRESTKMAGPVRCQSAGTFPKMKWKLKVTSTLNARFAAP